jgi:hypothetical protein
MPLVALVIKMQIICSKIKLFHEYINSLEPTCIKRNKVLKLDLTYM